MLFTSFNSANKRRQNASSRDFGSRHTDRDIIRYMPVSVPWALIIYDDFITDDAWRLMPGCAVPRDGICRGVRRH